MENIKDNRLLELRLKAQNSRFHESVQEVQGNASAGGYLRGGNYLRELHRVIEAELSESASVIAETLLEEYGPAQKLPQAESVFSLVESELNERKQYLERYIKDAARQTGLQNQSMLASHLTLEKSFPLIVEESRVCVYRRIEELKLQRGATVLARVKYWAENSPIIVGIMLVVVVLGAVKGFVDLLIWVFRSFGWIT
jgi:hypothetical protein